MKIIVPFPPGGGGDVVARIVAQQVGDMKGPTMVVEDQPGAGTVIATQNVVRSTPDGTTLLINNNSVVVVPQLRKLDYDPLSDLAPICDVASTPAVLVVNSASPYRTLDDFLAAARARPDDITVGGATGTVLNVGFEMLQRAANVRMTYVNYQGTNQAVNAVLGGHIVAALVDYPATAGQLQAGTLRALAVGSSRRIDWLPRRPTVADFGLKDYELDIWYGAFAPAKTPAGNRFAACRLVRQGGAGAADENPPCDAGRERRRPMRRAVRRLPPQTIRRVRPRHPRSEPQDRQLDGRAPAALSRPCRLFVKRFQSGQPLMEDPFMGKTPLSPPRRRRGGRLLFSFGLRRLVAIRKNDQIVVPYPPGGGADVVARVVADQIGNMHGPTMIIENRPGAAR